MSGTSFYVTPGARKVAAELGVDIASVIGTGPDGAVRACDVRAAARPRLVRPPSAAVVTGGTRFPVSGQSSLTDVDRFVEVDAYAVNPLLDDLRQIAPAVAADRQRQFGPAPTLFSGGDLPPFLTSGQDPALLMRLPWAARHAAARASLPELTKIFAALDGPPSAALIARAKEIGMRSMGAAMASFDYDARFRNWMGATRIPPDLVVGDGKTAMDRLRDSTPQQEAAAAAQFAAELTGANKWDGFGIKPRTRR